MKVTITIPASPHTIFTQETADSMVGQEFDATREIPGAEKILGGRGVVVAAKLVNPGIIEAEIEWPDK